MTDPRVFDEQVGNILKFTGATRPEPGAVFILVLGATGSGKTTFVSRCSGKTLEIGHDLSSCTSDLTITSFLHPSPADPTDIKTIYLLDTPGFDDTNLSDSETLTRISHYLAVAYANSIYISGIILMHRIIDPRLSGTARLNLEMFKHMLGETAYENVAIVTSMWSAPPTELEIQREKELIQGKGLLAEVLQGGGRAFRYSGFDIESGQSLPLSAIDYLLHQARAGPVVLQIQNELVDENRDLIGTSAGEFLADRQVLGLRREYDATIRGIRDGILGSELLDIQDGPLDSLERQKSKDQMDSELAELERKLQENQANLSKSLLRIHHDEERRLTAQMSQLEADLDARIAAKQEYLDQLTTTTTTTTMTPTSSTASSNPDIATSTELEIMYLRRDIQELRLEIEQKQAANNSVRNAFRSGMLFDTVGRVIGGVVATAVPALVAGSLCVLM
ncbi:hypothetical protein BJY01DRAFT_245040 [Aspergillus pseudoustus]|uniref:G domain-containing protein n=1 Tax=Aspergillus pseudoustus TaxID=1810923 RepID=A0ABR4KGW9_9EURO